LLGSKENGVLFYLPHNEVVNFTAIECYKYKKVFMEFKNT